MITAAITSLISLEFLNSIATSTQSGAESLRKIPGEGITWYKQRKENFMYADKTEYLEKLLDDELGNNFFFCSRPRRFGKSSFLQMANNFFRGNEFLFKGLHIYDRVGNGVFFKTYGVPKELEEVEWIQVPVIHLDFRRISNFDTLDKFENFYYEELRFIANSYGLDNIPTISISSLIFELRLKFKIQVILFIDEYDWPFGKALYEQKNRELAEKIRGFFDALLGNIKSCGDDLRLALILGISRLPLNSLESGANVFIDLTYKMEYAGMFGFTEKDIDDFKPEILQRFNLSEEKFKGFIDTLRKWYDGYNFTFENNGVKVNVLNPVSTMKYFATKKLGYYWTSTGSMRDIVRKLHFSQITLQRLEYSKLSKKDIERIYNPLEEPIAIEILMHVYGYLTIASYNKRTEMVTLNFPNEEIRTALQEKIDTYHPETDDFIESVSSMLLELNWHMKMGNIHGTMNTLQNMFFTYSKALEQGVNEFDVTRRLIDYIRRAGILCHDSKKFNKGPSLPDPGGDVDVSTYLLNTNFVMEIKHGHSAIKAIKQLIEYLEKYPHTFIEAIGNPKEAWFVGVNFISEAGGKLDEWIGIPLKNGVLIYDRLTASSEVLKDNFLNSIKKD